MHPNVYWWHWIKQLSNISPSVTGMGAEIKLQTHRLAVQHATSWLTGPHLIAVMDSCLVDIVEVK